MRAVFLDTDTLGPDDLDLSPLTALLPELECFPATRADQVADRVADADIVLVNKITLTGDHIRGARALKLVCLAATGVDNIDLEAAAAAGIVVSNIRHYCTPSVVQHVFALILTLTQRLDAFRDAVSNGAWAASEHFCLLDHPIRELSGKTIGIVGFGALGAAVGTVAEGFGLQVLAARRPYDRNDNAASGAGDRPARAGLGALFARADIISLHCPLTPETINLIDADALAAMRNDALLINTARGGLVNSGALVAALRDGQIAGAGIDVLHREPPVDPEPLLDARLENLIVTPHIAWAAREARQRAVNEMAQNIAGFLRGQPRNNVA